MLFVHTSNHLESLKNSYVGVTQSPLTSVFEKEIIVVQNYGMARWLSLHTSELQGISANTEYLFPAEFMWRLLGIVSPEVSEEDQCNPQSLRFRIYEELTKNHQAYPELKHYLHEENQINIWQLSTQVSQLLDQYLFYRSDWIKQWQSSDWDASKNWQSRLWRNCVTKNNLINWLSLQNQFKQDFTSIDKNKLPERIHFFSLSALSPGYIELLNELSSKTDIHIYLVDPSAGHYWGDSRSIKSQLKTNNDLLESEIHGNPILATMGNQGKEFINALINQTNAEHLINKIPEKTSDSLLEALQKSINENEQQINSSLDDSISINSCHSAVREIEVLSNQILDILNNNPSIQADDIVVMMPDIELYAPYIDAVFSTLEQQIPFSIADNKPSSLSDLIQVISLIFELPDKNYDVESVFEILEYAFIADKFNLKKKDIAECRKIVKQLNTRWGIDSKQRTSANFPSTNEHTWKLAFDNLLLGYAISDSLNSSEFDDLYNYDPENSRSQLPLQAFSQIEGSNSSVISSLKQFSELIFSIDTWKNKKQNLNGWFQDVRDFLGLLNKDSEHLNQVLQSFADLETHAETANFTQSLNFTLFKTVLIDVLNNTKTNENFLGHGISFCAMVPMRSVPFKVVCILGLNEGSYPRQNKPYSFDLTKNKPRQGDRSVTKEDRYLFLESLLAARSKLILSFIGQSFKDNTQLPPSVVLSELLDLFSYNGIDTNKLITQHPLQAYNSKYFKTQYPDYFSYDKKYIDLTKRSYANEAVFVTDKINLKDRDKTLSLSELVTFYQNPSSYFLQNNFDIQIYDDNDRLDIREPYKLDNFRKNQLQETLFENDSSDDETLICSRLKGLLPYGELGNEIFNKTNNKIKNFEQETEQCVYLDQPITEFRLELNQTIFFGSLDKITSIGRCIKQATSLYNKDLIRIWIEHIVFNNVNKDSQSVTNIITPDESFTLIPIENAQEKLQTLIEIYQTGSQFPLPFFRKTSADLFKDGNGPDYKKSRAAWNGNEYIQGEKEHFENDLLHQNLAINQMESPSAFEQVSRLIYQEFYKHIE